MKKNQRMLASVLSDDGDEEAKTASQAPRGEDDGLLLRPSPPHRSAEPCLLRGDEDDNTASSKDNVGWLNSE